MRAPEDEWICSTTAMKRIKSSPLVQMRGLLSPRVPSVPKYVKGILSFMEDTCREEDVVPLLL